MTRTQTAAPLPVVIEASRILWCDTCKAWTKHARARVKGQSLYVCGCGTEIVHYVVMKTETSKGAS